MICSGECRRRFLLMENPSPELALDFHNPWIRFWGAFQDVLSRGTADEINRPLVPILESVNGMHFVKEKSAKLPFFLFRWRFFFRVFASFYDEAPFGGYDKSCVMYRMFPLRRLGGMLSV
ncbi:hypothetical protein Poly51_53180 [Rubripirellula tenax]|uniref:Uncharacterized protein n=2 Tax=Rubripirellula tenax TaxID=2528015 RepID=A0A5C6EFF3_9BACT|nr:hypothetical protein Poly51_53180 [Rubripirellula tenax]